MESKQKKGGHNIEDQRKQSREDFSFTVVEYILPETTEKFIGFTLNLSRSGLCLYTPKLLKKGQEIIIKSDFPLISKKATVCWSEKYDAFYYKVGLEFVE
ncbi:MAG: PilZ domain-containing protein [Nitrospirota bacterium]